MVTKKSWRYFQSTICSWKWKWSSSLYANQVTCSPGPWAWIHPPWHMYNCFCHLFISSELHSLMYLVGCVWFKKAPEFFLGKLWRREKFYPWYGWEVLCPCSYRVRSWGRVGQEGMVPTESPPAGSAMAPGSRCHFPCPSPALQAS